jgi:hypothetical protein
MGRFLQKGHFSPAITLIPPYIRLLLGAPRGTPCLKTHTDTQLEPGGAAPPPPTGVGATTHQVASFYTWGWVEVS